MPKYYTERVLLDEAGMALSRLLAFYANRESERKDEVNKCFNLIASWPLESEGADAGAGRDHGE